MKVIKRIFNIIILVVIFALMIYGFAIENKDIMLSGLYAGLVFIIWHTLLSVVDYLKEKKYLFMYISLISLFSYSFLMVTVISIQLELDELSIERKILLDKLTTEEQDANWPVLRDELTELGNKRYDLRSKSGLYSLLASVAMYIPSILPKPKKSDETNSTELDKLAED